MTGIGARKRIVQPQPARRNAVNRRLPGKARSATRCAARVSPCDHAAAAWATSAHTVGVTRPLGQGYGSTAQATGAMRPRHTTPTVNASHRPRRMLSSALCAVAPLFSDGSSARTARTKRGVNQADVSQGRSKARATRL